MKVNSSAALKKPNWLIDLGIIDLKAEIEVRDQNNEGKHLKTSVGRIIFNDAFPKEIGFRNTTFDKSTIKKIVADCAKILI